MKKIYVTKWENSFFILALKLARAAQRSDGAVGGAAAGAGDAAVGGGAAAPGRLAPRIGGIISWTFLLNHETVLLATSWNDTLSLFRGKSVSQDGGGKKSDF